MVIKYHIIAVNNISDALAQVISDKDDLVTAADDLTTALNDLGTDIDATISTCASSGAACQTACDTFDTTPLTSASVDFSSVLQLNAFTFFNTKKRLKHFFFRNSIYSDKHRTINSSKWL